MLVSGYALIAFDFTGAICSMRSSDLPTPRLRARRNAAAPRPADSATNTHVGELGGSLDHQVFDHQFFEHQAEERPSIARAAMALLEACLDNESESGAGRRRPVIQLVRVGIAGVELLLGYACEPPPIGFSSSDGGLVWRLETPRDLSTEQILQTAEHIPELIALGEDDESTYFASPNFYDPPICDELPATDELGAKSRSGAELQIV